MIYGILGITFFGTIFLIEKDSFQNYSKEDDYDYVSHTIFENETPVVNTEVVLIRPYVDTEVKILKDFYDYKEEETNQQNSILKHEDTYLQNTGIIYGGKENFDVVSVLDGEVTEVKTDNLLGTIVEIKHTSNLISVYQSLGEVSISKGDIVKQGQIIGKSGTSNIETDLGSHVLFELIIKGQTVDPENYYEKTVTEIES